ncbi:MAG TPA: P-II family nitrogen regulator [Campylobacterales bacterium]|nr:P-II family nitrogen regulator [Campylobacterales bacterium]
MKMIMAVINEDRLSDVINALLQNDISGITVSETRGLGNINLSKQVDESCLNKKVKLEIVVSNDEYKSLAIDTIIENTHILNKGAGKIFVYNVDEVYRIRTGERDEDALK